jgi:hypothetical protein
MCRFFILSSFVLLLSIFAKAQVTDSLPPEEDFSQYANVETAGESSDKKYCTSKVIGLSPNKLISIGYDFQLSNVLNHAEIENLYQSEQMDIRNNNGLRLQANFPVISNSKWLLNLGVSYLENNYSVENKKFINPVLNTLKDNGLRSAGVNTTLFKPFDEKKFILLQSSFDWNGDYGFSLPQLNQLRVSAAAIYGIKKHERLIYGFGIARSYRPGEQNYIPVWLYNYTFRNQKMGFEVLLPARGHFRYSFNSRNILLAGFELEGNSYRLNKMVNQNTAFPYRNIQLQRSEIRLRLIYEFSVYKFVWLSIQGGYRINYRYNLDESEFFRGFFGDQKYLAENKLSNPLYFQVSLNLVSP